MPRGGREEGLPDSCCIHVAGDDLAIAEILKLDSRSMDLARRKKRMTVCGYGPIVAAIEASKMMGASTGELLKYATSYDGMPAESAVGYGAILFR